MTFVFLFPLLLTYFLLVLILFFVFISHFILLCYELFNKIDFNNTTYNKLPNFWINYFFWGVTIESNHQWTQIGSFNRKTHLKKKRLKWWYSNRKQKNAQRKNYKNWVHWCLRPKKTILLLSVTNHTFVCNCFSATIATSLQQKICWLSLANTLLKFLQYSEKCCLTIWIPKNYKIPYSIVQL